MTKITKNSTILIKDSRELWNNKTGVVVSNIIDDSLDQYVKVKVNLGDNKNVIETFLLSDLELIFSDDTLALENLNEAINFKSAIIKQCAKKARDYIVSKYGTETDLCGKCIEASDYLIDLLTDANIPAKVIEGYIIYDNDENCSDRAWDEHTWVELSDGTVVDVTVEQFNPMMDVDYPPILIEQNPHGYVYDKPRFLWLENLNEHLMTQISRRDNPNDFSPFGYKVDFYDGDKHIGEGSVCGIKDDNAFLYDFEVYPEFRGKGYSKEMLQYLIDQYDLKQLFVKPDNTVAINLYKKYGFKFDDSAYDSDDIGNMRLMIRESVNKSSISIEGVSSPEELMDWMNENITYELVDDEYSNSNGVPTKTAKEVLDTGTGHCAEQSYLEKEVLDNLGYETFLVMVKENNSKKEYGAEGSAHVFLVYKEGKNYCWFEHSMQHAKGIHKYTSLEALLQDVANRWWRYDKNSDILEVRMMDKIITGVDNWGLAKECYKLPVEYTFDISDNIMESDVPLEESYKQRKHVNESIEKTAIEAMNKAIISEFGRDYPGEGCICIAPDGTFINLYPKLPDHEDLCTWLTEQGFDEVTPEAEWLVETLDYVRCRNNPASLCYVELPLKTITRSQIYSLEEWLEDKVSHDHISIELPDGIWKRFSLKEYFPEDIIKKIKRYYASGTLYENIESSQLTDIIKPYLIDDFGNDTWFNVNKIAQAESLSADQVIYIAKTLGYNIYKIYTKHKTFKIVAPKSMDDIEFIRDNFGAYLSGFIRTEKL